MKTNRLDNVTDLVKERLGSAVLEARKQFKGTNPYRKEPITKKEQIYDFETQRRDTFDEIASERGVDAATQWERDFEEQLIRGQTNG